MDKSLEIAGGRGMKMMYRIYISIFLMRFIFLMVALLSTIEHLLGQASPLININSPYDEQNPVISLDGNELYFTIANHPENIGGIKDPGDIWVSLFINGQWQAPIHAGSVINNENYNTVLGFTATGDAYLWGHYFASGEVRTQGIAVAQKNAAGIWTTPTNITIPYFLNRSGHASGFVNLSGDVFVFSAEAYGTVGGEDIYVSFKKDGRWSEPLNLGKDINTSFQEWAPYMSDDNRTLYFSSNGLKGSGSFDVFVSQRLDDNWKQWSVPIPLGREVNTESRELYFRAFRNVGYSLFTSTHDSNRYGVIKVIKDSLFSPKPPRDTLSIAVEKINQSNAITVFGKVTNSKNKLGILATVRFVADSSFTVLAKANGEYRVTVPIKSTYSVRVECGGFVSVAERLDLNGIHYKSLEFNFSLQPIEVGTVVNLKSILFSAGTTLLLEESYPELNTVVDFMKRNPKVEIQLEGHTDNRGDAKKNLVLSQKRVEKIKSYLVANGISARRVKGKGFGDARPIATNDTEEARKLNRRVEFLILKN
jgi:outer membrane protein OmpA-like peptidoglycan-associated protein